MKVLIIAHQLDSLFNIRNRLLKDIKNLGHDLSVWAPEVESDNIEKLKGLGIPYRPIPLNRTGMNPIADMRALFALVVLLRQEGPDVVLTTAIKPTIYGSLAARIARIKKVFSIIPGLGFAFAKRQTIKEKLIFVLVQFLYRIALPKNKGIFFQNPDDRNLFLDLKLIDEKQCFQINGSGVDLDHYSCSDPVTKPPVFLLIARLLNDKGILEYVEAARKLKPRYKDVSFKLLGPYDSNPAAISPDEIKLWCEEGSIEYCGETQDVRPFIASCSVYVLPSYREGTPRSVLEAMSMGKPIVTTDAPGCRETVVHGENGYLVPVKDATSLASAMEKFIVDIGKIETMGCESRRIAESKYDVRMVNETILLVMGLIDKKTTDHD